MFNFYIFKISLKFTIKKSCKCSLILGVLHTEHQDNDGLSTGNKQTNKKQRQRRFFTSLYF